MTGVSGSGKTAVATELQRRGYQAIHGDRELAYRGDPETGAPVVPEGDAPSAAWMSEHHVWDVDQVKAHIDGDSRTQILRALFSIHAKNAIMFRL